MLAHSLILCPGDMGCIYCDKYRKELEAAGVPNIDNLMVYVNTDNKVDIEKTLEKANTAKVPLAQQSPFPKDSSEQYKNYVKAMKQAAAASKFVVPFTAPKPNYKNITKPVKWDKWAKAVLPSNLADHGFPIFDVDCRMCAAISKLLREAGLEPQEINGYNYVMPKGYEYDPVGFPVNPDYLGLGDNGNSFFAGNVKMYRTQKARGLQVLRNNPVFQRYNLPQLTLSEFDLSIFPHTAYKGAYPVFVRPCPVVPRHGFVESRSVKDANAALAVVAETLREDPQGEIIFMPRMSGKWSGIATHANIAFGLNNDGATGGKSVKTVPAYVEPKHFIKAVGADQCRWSTIKTAPYVEFVEEREKPVFVQLRDGPETPRSKNYIPQEITVTGVLDTRLFDDDLLLWEKAVKDMLKSCGKGAVVYHPKGSLTSHFSVHAIACQMAVILDGPMPKPGDVLKPEGWEPEALKPSDYKKIAKRLAARLSKSFADFDYADQRTAVLTAVGALHAMPQWGREEHLLALRAEGFAATLVFTTAACLGELRHWWSAGPGRSGMSDDNGRFIPAIENPRNQLVRRDKASPTGQQLNREQVYEESMKLSSIELHKAAKECALDMPKEVGWSSGYGGDGWASAANWAAKGFEAAERFIRHPTAKRWLDAVLAYNTIINQVHNNGKILTKWISSETMSAINSCPGPAFINAFAANVVLGIRPAPQVEPYGLNTVPLLDGQDGQLPVFVDDPTDPCELDPEDCRVIGKPAVKVAEAVVKTALPGDNKVQEYKNLKVGQVYVSKKNENWKYKVLEINKGTGRVTVLALSMDFDAPSGNYQLAIEEAANIFNAWKVWTNGMIVKAGGGHYLYYLLSEVNEAMKTLKYKPCSKDGKPKPGAGGSGTMTFKDAQRCFYLPEGNTNGV